jgi:redox-sensitive bicupin YhaK (pirin superfamily)
MIATPTPQLDIRRANERFATQIPWLDSKHSFSFGHHRDVRNTHHGLLLVNNDDVVAPGTGFDTHPHRDMEIVTWVLRGSLVHQDSEGHSGVIYPGLAQRMSAGSGILHSEKNDSWRWDTGHEAHSDPVHFVQMWVVPDQAGIAPGYEQLEIAAPELDGQLAVVASGMAKHAQASAIRISQRYAALHAARLAPGQSVTLPDAPYLHLFVPVGAVDLESAGRLETGDAVRFTSTGGQRVTALESAEILLWEMHAGIGAGH